MQFLQFLIPECDFYLNVFYSKLSKRKKFLIIYNTQIYNICNILLISFYRLYINTILSDTLRE